MPVIHAITGNETQETGLAKMHVFFVPRTFGVENKEMFINTVPSEQGVSIVGQRALYTSVLNLSRELGGTMHRSAYDVTEGTILKVYAQRKGKWNSLTMSGQVFLLVRAEAALRELKVATLQRPQSRYPHFELKGRFDVLSLEYARDVLGVQVAPQFERLFNPSYCNSLFQFSILDPEKSALRRVEIRRSIGEDGKPSVSVEIKRRRKLTF